MLAAVAAILEERLFASVEVAAPAPADAITARDRAALVVPVTWQSRTVAELRAAPRGRAAAPADRRLLERVALLVSRHADEAAAARALAHRDA